MSEISSAKGDHVKALQQMYPRVEKFFRTTMKNTNLSWVFSGMDQFGGPEQEIEFLLCSIEYTNLAGNIREDDLYQPTWTNNTDAQNTVTFNKTYEESNQATFKMTNGLRLGSSLKVGAEAEAGIHVPVVDVAGAKAKVSTELTVMSEFSFQSELSVTKTKKVSHSISEVINIPPRTKVFGSVLLKTGTFNAKFKATFKCTFTDYAGDKYGARLEEMAPGVDLYLYTSGYVSGNNSINLEVITNQKSLDVANDSLTDKESELQKN